MFGEFEEMIIYHSFLIKIVLGLLVLGMIIPFLSTSCNKTIRRMRIYMFFSHGFITSVAFSGLVALVFAQIDFNFSIFVMILVYILLSLFESMKYLNMLKVRFEAEVCVKKIRDISLKYTLINIAMVAILIVWKIMEHKSAVPIS